MRNLYMGIGDRTVFGATGRFRLLFGEPGHTLFKIVSSVRGYHV